MPDLVDRPLLSAVAIVKRHLGPEWDDDIETSALEDGSVHVRCLSELAFEQARFNLTPFVRNDEADWEAAAESGVQAGQFEITLIDPQTNEYPDHVVGWFKDRPVRAA